MQRILPLFPIAFNAFRAVKSSELPAAIGPPPDANPLALGFYATHEMQEPTALEIEGSIPSWLTGSLYRGGAGTWDVGNYTAEHWFDGFSRNHKFEIADGVVTYRSRNSSDELIHFVRETGLYPSGSFGSDPCKIIYGAMVLSNDGRSAAHPFMGTDGSIYNYLLDMSLETPAYRVFGIQPPNGEAKILANITDAPPAYVHSLFGTQNHLILIVWQADFVKPGKTLMESIGSWDPERKSLFYVIDRVNGGVVAKYESKEAFFAFHQINSFESDNGDIYIDLPTMPDTSFLSAAEVPNLRANIGTSHGSSKNDVPGTFTRYRLPFLGANARAANGSLTMHTAEIDFTLPYAEANIELPRINEEFHARPYRYAYGVHVNNKGYFSDSIIKIDTQTKESKTWTPSVKHLPSEPIFVPTPGGECEDDGVLLTVAMDTTKRASSLVVINATTMEEVGRARMPIVMGYGFHGVWGS